MRIVQDASGHKYIDQQLKDYITNIFLTYDVSIPNDKAILFAKNSTLNKLINDYTGTGIHRVIKREKAEYVIINRIPITNYPQYFDGVNITNDDTKEVVYGIYNNSMEDKDTIDLIVDFINRGQQVTYVNQDVLNNSLNNGFVIDRESYGSIKELINSEHVDNHIMAVNMLVDSKLEQNWEWIIYLFHKKYQLLQYDKKNVIHNYFKTLNLPYSTNDILNSIDKSLTVVKDKNVIEGFEFMVRDKFNKNIEKFLQDNVGTTKFTLEDFKLSLK